MDGYGRRSRTAGVLGVTAIAAVTVFWMGTGYGEQPECGTGSYFLASLGPWFGLLFYGPVITAIAGVLIIAMAGRRVGPPLVIGLVVVETAAAVIGTGWSWTTHGCAQYTSNDHVTEAGWTMGIAGGVGAVLMLGLAALVSLVRGRHRPSRSSPDRRPGVGRYTVRSVAAHAGSGLRPGDRAWVAVDDDEVRLAPVADAAGEAPPAWRIDRHGLVVDQLGWTTSLWSEGRLLVELDPSGIGTQFELVQALTASPQPGVLNPAGPPR